MKRNIIDASGNRLSYAEYGDENGYPILIQHGLIASIDDYHLFDRLIRLKARLICIARPGYGESSPVLMDSFADWADLVSPLIQELKLARFDILGMSSGAPYGYSLGSGFPDQVRNIYIFSGIPALYDQIVLSSWPYEPIRNQNLEYLEGLAKELFFPNVTAEAMKQDDIRDSMMNNCFGLAQDLKLRFADWGFDLSDVNANVFMRHSKADDLVPFATAVRTAQLLPNCRLELAEAGPHFSSQALDDFIRETMAKHLPS